MEKEEVESNNISIARSDGLDADLLTVLRAETGQGVRSPSGKMGSFTAGSLRRSSLEQTEESSEAAQVISAKRSDGINHDILNVLEQNAKEGRLSHSESTKGMPSEKSKPKGTLKKIARNLRSLSFTSMSTIPQSSRQSTGMFDKKFDKTNSKVVHNSNSRTRYATPNSVRIAHFSDTQNFLTQSSGLRSLYLPKADVMIHSGNFSINGSDKEFAQFNGWLGAVSSKYEYRIVVLGRHDVRLYGTDWALMKCLLSNATHVLCHEEIEVLGMRIYGCPWHWGHSKRYVPTDSAPSNTSFRFDEITAEPHILVTHAAAQGKNDYVHHTGGGGSGSNMGGHVGNPALTDSIARVKPFVHLHGQIHEGRGIVNAIGRSPLVINSCMCDKDSTVLAGTPHVLNCSHINLPDINLQHWTFAVGALEL